MVSAAVFLALDIKHDRPVALKVFLSELSAALGAERFLQEIRTTARLQHPNILPVHDSGEAKGHLWYTMPFVEGESLRRRLRNEVQLPVEEALRITREVADALDTVHRHGVVHRDIKPENILLSEGHALVADFGVARALESAGADRLTETGLALGTPTYMSPEQASADHHVDGRSDIYSLGCVLYEMLTGEPPFTGPTPHAVFAKRATLPPPSVRTVREAVPESVESVVRKALAKVPADRYATAGEFAKALAAPVVEKSPPARRQRKPVVRILGILVGLLIAVAMIAGIRSLWTRSTVGAPAHRQLTFAGNVTSVALSPDGKMLAYVSQLADSQVLMVREVTGGTPLEIASFNEICCVGWSLDNEQVRFGAETLDSLTQGTYIALAWEGRHGGSVKLYGLPGDKVARR